MDGWVVESETRGGHLGRTGAVPGRRLTGETGGTVLSRSERAGRAGKRQRAATWKDGHRKQLTD